MLISIDIFKIADCEDGKKDIEIGNETQIKRPLMLYNLQLTMRMDINHDVSHNNRIKGGSEAQDILVIIMGYSMEGTSSYEGRY